MTKLCACVSDKVVRDKVACGRDVRDKVECERVVCESCV